MIAAEKERFEKDLNSKKNHLSEEQVQQLMREHAETIDTLSRNINVEKDRQLNALASKIAEKRKMKAAILARKHEAEVAKELVKQQEERHQVEDIHVRNLILQYSILFSFCYCYFRSCHLNVLVNNQILIFFILLKLIT